MLYSELKAKEVVSIKDCRRLGHVCNMEIDPCTGCVRKIMVPAKCHCFFSFGNEPDLAINFSDIRQIGPDIILVNI
ncbi:MAG: PRC-barrel domain-containing protein [Lachnospiraceae bacterium]